MCGRFPASRSAVEVARWFKTSRPLPNLRQRYNAAPTQDLGVVLRDTVKSFTIIATTPNALCAPVHNRVPMILDEADLSRVAQQDLSRRRRAASIVAPPST
jgi:putative SOS response-associated peptidase YedK